MTLSQFAVSVEGHVIVDAVGEPPHTTYVLKVSLKNFGTSWEVYKRYSKFVQLEQRLAAQFPLLWSPSVGNHDLILSGKDGWFADGLEPQVVKNREVRIRKFFEALLAQPDSVWMSDTVCNFLRIPASSDHAMDVSTISRPASSFSVVASTADYICTPPPLDEKNRPLIASAGPFSNEDTFCDWFESQLNGTNSSATDSDRMHALSELRKVASSFSWTQKFCDRISPLILNEIARVSHVASRSSSSDSRGYNGANGIDHSASSPTASSVNIRHMYDQHLSASSVCYLKFLSELVSIERNPEAAAVVHVLRNLDREVWRGLNLHVRNPTICGNRMAVFRICKYVGVSPHNMLSDDDVAVSQYLNWLGRETTFAQYTVG